MLLLQHILVTKLIYKKDKEFYKILPWVILPDAIRGLGIPRACSHFEKSQISNKHSFLTYPTEIKNLSIKDLNDSYYIASNLPCAIGEEISIKEYELCNSHIIDNYTYEGIKEHLRQDIVFDNFIRKLYDCKDKLSNHYIVKKTGKSINGIELRKETLNLENELGFYLSEKVFDEFEINVCNNWLESVIKPILKKQYSITLYNSVKDYIKIPNIRNQVCSSKFNNLYKQLVNI